MFQTSIESKAGIKNWINPLRFGGGGPSNSAGFRHGQRWCLLENLRNSSTKCNYNKSNNILLQRRPFHPFFVHVYLPTLFRNLQTTGTIVIEIAVQKINTVRLPSAKTTNKPHGTATVTRSFPPSGSTTTTRWTAMAAQRSRAFWGRNACPNSSQKEISLLDWIEMKARGRAMVKAFCFVENGRKRFQRLSWKPKQRTNL